MNKKNKTQRSSPYRKNNNKSSPLKGLFGGNPIENMLDPFGMFGGGGLGLAGQGAANIMGWDGSNRGDSINSFWNTPQFMPKNPRFGFGGGGDLQGQVDKAFGEFGDIDTETNLFRGAQNMMNIGDNFGGVNTNFQNQFGNLQNRYAGMQNTMEDLTVNQQQAQFEAQQGSQQRANIMQNLQGAAGGSGVAGLAQAMANQGQQQSQRASASIGQQAADIAMGQGAMEAQKYQLQGLADARDLTLQQKQGELSFLAGQLEAQNANQAAENAGK